MKRALATAVAVALLATLFTVWPPSVALAAPAHAANVARQFSVAELANVDILAADLTPGSARRPNPAYRITVGIETATVFSCRMDDGGGAVTYPLNAGAALVAGFHTFTIGTHNDFTYNFQVETAGNVTLLVEEVYGGQL